jgi:formylglycine-generating enzyme required for sulfatase activity
MKEIRVPAGGLVFPVGTSDNAIAGLTGSFALAETEMTNKLAAEVFQWALGKGYLSTESGAPNEVNPETVTYGTRELLNLDDTGGYCRINFADGAFTVDKGYENHPVVLAMIDWHGALMLCNWLTEMEEGHTGNLVYSGIDTDLWNDSAIIEDRTRTGYRLPNRNEWECAARWFGTDPAGRTDLVSRGVNGGDADLTAGFWWLPGNYTSGASAPYTDQEACRRVAVFFDDNTTKNPVEPAATGSLGKNGVNALGLYDMSGNVREWVMDWTPGMTGDPFVILGGSWNSVPHFLQIGGWFNVHNPYYEYEDIGFRLCRTL